MCLLTWDVCECCISKSVSLCLILGVSGDNRLLFVIIIVFCSLKMGSRARSIFLFVMRPVLFGLRSFMSVVLSEQPVFKVINWVVFGSIRVWV